MAKALGLEGVALGPVVRLSVVFAAVGASTAVADTLVQAAFMARAGADALAPRRRAVDAVCAAAFAAAVAESPLTGPGAGGFLLVRSPSGEAALMDFFVAAPGLGPRGRRLDPADLDHFTVPFGGAEQVFHIGPASVAVPGMVAGLGEAVRRHGRLSLAEVVAPAAALAPAHATHQGDAAEDQHGQHRDPERDHQVARQRAEARRALGGRGRLEHGHAVVA